MNIKPSSKKKPAMWRVSFWFFTKALKQAKSDAFDQPKVMTLRKESHAKTIRPIMKVNGKFSNLNADIVFTSIKFMPVF